MAPPLTAIPGFWNRVTKKADGCWIYPGSRTRGYGQVYVAALKRSDVAHRVAWKLAKGDIPDGLMVLHKCDVRACVNPDHLFLGTAGDNARDAVSKGRWIPRGAAIKGYRSALRRSKSERRSA